MRTWERVESTNLSESSRKAYDIAVGAKWIFKVKYDENGDVERFKARLVAKGYSQVEGINYSDTFAPTLTPTILRYILSFGFEQGYEIDHIDIETAFLHGELEEEVFMKLPKECGEDSDRVVRLLRPLYGLKQAPRCWNKRFVSFILSLGYTESTADPCLFYRTVDGRKELLSVFVDDGLLIGMRKSVDEIREKMSKEFKLRNLGPVKHILGIKVERTESELSLSQSHYIEEVLERFGMKDCKPAPTPLPLKLERDSKEALTPFRDINLYQQLVGALIYISNNTRPDITYSVGVLARKMSSPSDYDYSLGKRVLRYLRGTTNAKLIFRSRKPLLGYSDASYAESEDRKSTTGFVFTMNNGAIGWKSKKQSIVSCSSTEAEYIALSTTGKEALWLRKVEKELRGERDEAVIIFEDNESTIKLASNPINNDRSKHIDVRYHMLRDRVRRGEIGLKYISTKFQLADLLTKSLAKDQHYFLSKEMGLVF